MAFINYVTQIQFEFGAVQLLRQECDRVGITRPLIVTDPGVKAAGVLQKALDALPGQPHRSGRARGRGGVPGPGLRWPDCGGWRFGH